MCLDWLHGVTCLLTFAYFREVQLPFFYRLVYKFHHFFKGLSLSSSKRNHYGLHICMDPLATWPVGLSRRLVHGKTCISCGSERCCLWLSWPADSFGAQKALGRKDRSFPPPKTNEYPLKKIAVGTWKMIHFPLSHGPSMHGICTYISFEKSSKCRYILLIPFPWILWVGKERWKNILTSIFFQFFFSWLAFPTAPFVVKCWRRDVPLGTLLMVHSLAHHQNSLNSGTMLLWFWFIFIWVKYISYFFSIFPFLLGCVSFSYFKEFFGKKHIEIIPKKPPKTKTPQKCVGCRRMPLTPLLGAFWASGRQPPSLEVLGVIACYSGALLMCLGLPAFWEVWAWWKKGKGGLPWLVVVV